MHIEKCQITTTETRTREMYVTETAIKTGLCGCSIWSKGGPGYIPVTLTYPAPVQVEGVRVEMTLDEFRALCMVDLRNSGNAKELVLKMREFSIPEADQPSPISTFGVKDAFEKVREAVGDKLDGVDPLAKAEQDPRAAELQRAVARLAATLPKAKVGPPFNEPASDGTVYGSKPEPQGLKWPPFWEAKVKQVATMPTCDKCGDKLTGHEDDSATRCRWCVTAAPAQPAPQDAGEVDLTVCPKCGGEADNGFTREIPPSPYWCSKCVEGETGLPWHDLGPGLSVAVVDGKGVYIARHDPRCGIAYFLKNNGGYVDIDQHPTLAAAKAACDAHHA